ncbi:MAG: helix-turn-helix domain-containing protein [Chthoniobacteraceae bacterium]
MTPADDNSSLSVLSASRMYQDYARAFTRGTGLPLDLHAPEVTRVINFARKDENPFCALMAKTNQSCAACYGLQQKLESEAQLAPKTLKCFAGLCETAVPVRVGDKLIAFLQTGHILTHRPNRTEFNKVARTLLSFGAEVDLKRLEEAYFNTRVLAPKQYEALIRLLTIFAEHLGECSEALALKSQPEEPTAIANARIIIAEQSADQMSLAAVARAVNMSASYFSAKFKEITGINFVAYVARTRIEKARHLLQNPKLRVSEIAYEVGFQSLSQFNRAFKSFTGKAPSEYRQSLAG